MGDNENCTLNALGNWNRGKTISTYMHVGRIKSTSGFSMLNYVVGTVIQCPLLATICSIFVWFYYFQSSPKSIPCIVANIRQKYRILYLSNNRIASPLITSYTLAYIGRLYTTLQIFNVCCLSYSYIYIYVLYF